MTKSSVYIKTCDVINSCETNAQLIVARRYLGLGIRRKLIDMDSAFFDSLQRMITFKVRELDNNVFHKTKA